jgi:hypothetical protein
MPGDLGCRLAILDEPLQPSVRYERGRPGRISFLFDLGVVIASNNVSITIAIFDSETAGLMSKENVADLLHKSRLVPSLRVRGV